MGALTGIRKVGCALQIIEDGEHMGFIPAAIKTGSRQLRDIVKGYKPSALVKFYSADWADGNTKSWYHHDVTVSEILSDAFFADYTVNEGEYELFKECIYVYE